MFDTARSYSRQFPCAFTKAIGSRLIADDGREFVDFLAGAGALNYGHNHPHLKARLSECLAQDATRHAKRTFMEAFDDVILRPRGLEYALRFPGPGGSNAVVAAFELARRVTGRRRVIAFTNGSHGMTHDVTTMPFDGFLGPGVDTLDVLEASLASELPAAFIVEAVQGEGGVNVARNEWLRGLTRIARDHGVMLIVDDIQTGCGRCGSFFSFEDAGIAPDVVCLSKALSGFGLPIAVALVRPDVDLWAPLEHDGNDLAFVTATAALDFWRSRDLMREVQHKGAIVADRLQEIALRLGTESRGRGLVHGLDLGADGRAREVARRAFDAGLVIEPSGPAGRVLKILPPLTIAADELAFGLDVIEATVVAAAPAVLEAV